MGFLGTFKYIVDKAKDSNPDMKYGIAGHLHPKLDELHHTNLNRHINLNRCSFIDNVFRNAVIPKIGSVVICDLAFGFEHSGIYVGDKLIIHKDGSGILIDVDPDEFINRLDGKNNAISIYVACHDNEAITIEGACTRAKEALNSGDFIGYDLLNNNCHHFTRYCLTGDTDQWGFDFTFSSLESLLVNKFGMNNWRVWKYYE